MCSGEDEEIMSSIPCGGANSLINGGVEVGVARVQQENQVEYSLLPWLEQSRNDRSNGSRKGRSWRWER